jgi:hypothetical protein
MQNVLWGTLMHTEFETPKGKRPLGISKRRWEDNIKIDLK